MSNKLVTRDLWAQAEEPAKTDSPSPAPAPAVAAPQGPSLPFQMPKFQAPSFEKVQVPSFGTKQEPSSAPVAPPSPSPASTAKVPFSFSRVSALLESSLMTQPQAYPVHPFFLCLLLGEFSLFCNLYRLLETHMTRATSFISGSRYCRGFLHSISRIQALMPRVDCCGH